MTNLKHSRLTTSAFYLHAAIYLILLLLVLQFNNFYFTLDSEHGLVELTGALSLFLTSLVLFKSARDVAKKKGRKNYHFIMFAFMSVLFFWAAGEELSWGQHILGTVTPDWLAEINGQKETNIHNINKKFFDRWLERFTVLLAVITAIQHFRGKEYFAKFRLPEYPLNLAFLLIPIYRKLQEFNHDVWHWCFIVCWGYPILALKKKDYKMLRLSILFTVTFFSVIYVHHNYFHMFRGVSNFYHEVREMIFSILTIFYAIQLNKDVKEY